MKKIVFILSIVFIFQFCSGKKDSELTVQGIVEADIVTMKSTVGGKIEKLFYGTGDRVKKDSILACIDSDKIENKIKDIELGLKEIKLDRERLILKERVLDKKTNFLNKQYKRLKRLNKKKAVSGEKLEKTKLSLDESIYAKKEIVKNLEILKIKQKRILNNKQYLELMLKDFKIVSPTKGIILDRFVSEGENILPGSPVYDIYNENSLYIEVYLEEGEIGRLKLNQKVKIIMDGNPDKNLYGKIIYFGKKAEFSPKYIVSEKERKELLYLVKIEVENHKELYKIGMPVTVEIKR